MKLPIKDFKFPVKESEEKVNDLYKTIISFFVDRMDKLEERMEEVGVIKKKQSVTASGIAIGALAGLAVGAIAALKSPINDISLPSVKNMKVPVKATGEKVNNLYHNALSFFENRLHKVEDKMEDVGLIERKTTGPGIVLGLISGLAVGAIAALLLAKDNGEDFRTKVVNKFDETKEKLTSKKEDTLHFAKKETENVKNAATAQTRDFTSNI